MDILGILGLLILVALAWWVLQQFSAQLPPLLVTICYVVLVIVAVIALCNMLGIPIGIPLSLRGR